MKAGRDCCKPPLNTAEEDEEEIREATAELIRLCGIKENWSHLESIEEIWCQCRKSLCFADERRKRRYFAGHTYMVPYSKICSLHLTHPFLSCSGLPLFSAQRPDPDLCRCIWSQALTGKLVYNKRLWLGWSRKLFSAEKQILPEKSKLCCWF